MTDQIKGRWHITALVLDRYSHRCERRSICHVAERQVAWAVANALQKGGILTITAQAEASDFDFVFIPEMGR